MCGCGYQPVNPLSECNSSKSYISANKYDNSKKKTVSNAYEPIIGFVKFFDTQKILVLYWQTTMVLAVTKLNLI